MQIHGRHGRVRQLLELRRRARPADEPDRGRQRRGRSTVIGWQTADRLFGTEIDPLEKIIQIEGVHFRVVGVSAKRGSLLGQSQDEFAVIPLGQFQMMFGSRRQLSLTVKPRDLSQISQAMDEATVALRSARRLKPKQPDNFGMFTSDTILDIYHSATNGIFAVLVGVVGAVARGRRHRHHEHHADGGDRADARDRPAQGARRAAVGHHGADADRVGGAVDVRRRHRHDLRGGDRAWRSRRSRRFRRRSKLWSVALGIGITALVGLFFGLYPAMRAARLDPIEALA